MRRTSLIAPPRPRIVGRRGPGAASADGDGASVRARGAAAHAAGGDRSRGARRRGGGRRWRCGLVASAARPRREPRPPGRRELRQRLQRRRPWHRRRPGRTAASRRIRARRTGCRQARRVHRLRRRRRRRPRPRCGDHVVAARRRGSQHPGGLVLHRRATSIRVRRVSASSSCSSSSGWSRRSARRTSLIERLTSLSTVMGAGAGCLACALLVINNLRDRPSDAAVGKRTLAVRIGDALDPDALRRVARRGIRLRRDRRALAPVGAPGVRRGTAGGSRGAPRTRRSEPGGSSSPSWGPRVACN